VKEKLKTLKCHGFKLSADPMLRIWAQKFIENSMFGFGRRTLA